MIIFFKRLEAKQSSPKSVDRVQLSLRDFLDSLFNSRLDEEQWYGSLIEKVLLVELWLEGFQGS